MNEEDTLFLNTVTSSGVNYRTALIVQVSKLLQRCASSRGSGAWEQNSNTASSRSMIACVEDTIPTQYDVERIKNVIESVDWPGLCSDENLKRLSEFLECLKNAPCPYIIALSLMAVILRLSRGGQNSQVSRLQPAHRLIFDSVCCILNQQSMKLVVPTIVLRLVHQFPSVESCKLMLSMLKHWDSSPLPSYGISWKAVFPILDAVDRIEVSPSRSNDTTAVDLRIRCFADLDVLHGEEPSSGAKAAPKRTCQTRNHTKVRVNHVLNSKSNGFGKKAVFVLRYSCVSFLDKLLGETERNPASVIHKVLNSLLQFRDSKSLRILLLYIVVNGRGSKAGRSGRLIEQLMQQLLQKFQDDTIYVDFFVQLLVELSEFDDPEKLLRLFLELANLAMENREENRISVRIRYGISYILSRRGGILAKRDEVIRWAAEVSIIFDSSAYWIDPSIGREEQKRQRHALQSLGILGILQPESAIPQAQREGSPTLQSIARSLHPYPFPHDFFSSYSPTNTAPLVRASKKPILGEDTIPSLPDEVMSNIVSYLNYKRLVRMRLVSQRVRDVADQHSLWLPLYKVRFGDEGFVSNELLKTATNGEVPDRITGSSPTLLNLNWKQLFQNQWLAEKEASVRQRDIRRGPVKIVVCTYLGCHQLLFRRDHERRQCSKHVKPKRKAVAERKRKTKKSKI